jgi:hypothetical protein
MRFGIVVSMIRGRLMRFTSEMRRDETRGLIESDGVREGERSAAEVGMTWEAQWSVSTWREYRSMSWRDKHLLGGREHHQIADLYAESMRT